MRYKTAGILSLLLVGSMFVLPAAVMTLLFPWLKDPLTWYERMILDATIFLLSWRFLLALPIVGLLFTAATLTELITPRR